MAPVEIVHLTYAAPSASGSYNRMVGTQMLRLHEFKHAAISLRVGDSEERERNDASVLVVNHRQLSAWQRGLLHVPERLRQRRFNGITDKNSLVYLWGVQRLLPTLRPSVVICYDMYKMGRLLRQIIDWPCRLVLSQHGLSYYLPAARASTTYSLSAFDVICVLSRASYRCDRMRQSFYEPMVTVIPNGVDTERFRPAGREATTALRAAFNLPRGKLIVLVLGRLAPKKGVHAILSAWPRILESVPDAFLWIVGDGEARYRLSLERVVSKLKLSSTVGFQGAVAAAGVARCYQASDAYVFPTLCAEGMPLSLLEAMSCGLPCISSEFAVAREHFSGEAIAFVEDPNIDGAFVEPVVRLLRNESLRDEMGQRARSLVIDKFSQEVWLASLRKFYKEQLELVGRNE